jgi:hypothetical protein
MAGNQARLLGCLWVASLIDNDMDRLGGWHGGPDGVKEADELLVTMTLFAAPDHFAIQHVEGGE